MESISERVSHRDLTIDSMENTKELAWQNKAPISENGKNEQKNTYRGRRGTDCPEDCAERPDVGCGDDMPIAIFTVPKGDSASVIRSADK